MGEPGISELEEVTVTARRLEEDIRTVPVSVTLVNSERLEALAINTPLDLNKIAGLGGAPIGGLANVNFSIRGQGTAYGGQPGVISYFAEVPGFPLTYFDLKNVQVIKGPQGTLFGQTSIGGVVLFEPRRPTTALEGYLDVQAGGHRYTQLEGALNVPLFDEHLLIRVAGQLRNRNGWATASYSDGRPPADLNNVDTASLRVAVTWKPVDNFESYTIYAQDAIHSNGTSSLSYYVDSRFMNPGVRNLVPASIPSFAAAWQFWTGASPPPGQSFSQLLQTAHNQQLSNGPLATNTDYSQRTTTVNRGLVNQTNWDISSSLRARNIFGLRWQTLRGAVWDIDGTGLPLDDVQCRFVPGTTSSSGTCADTGGWPARTLTDELQLQGSHWKNRLQWQLGAFYLQGGVRDFLENTGPYVVFGKLFGDPASASFCTSVSVASPCTSLARTTTTSRALFGQLNYELFKGLHVTAGWRETWDYTRTDSTGKASYGVQLNGLTVAVPTYGGSRAAGSTIVSTEVALPANGSYNLSTDWQVTDRTLLYLAHRSGYKAGGINSTASPGTPFRVYGPERARDLELGTKSEWTAGSVHGFVAADFFHTWHRNIQGGQIIPGQASTITTNIANANIDGLELEGTVYATDWFRVSANVALTDARYSKWLETSTCAAQYWRPQCAGLAGSAPILIDHAQGSLTVGGQTLRFTPDRFANTSRWQWAVQPALLLHRWLAADVTVSANVYHRGPYVDSTAVANTSKLVGVPMALEPTALGYSTGNPYDAPGYTLVDLRIDWNRIAGNRLRASASVTNLANKLYRVSSASAFEIIGAAYTVIGEPRMWFAQVAYDF
jgi:iron complex outermembrane receptor protein